MVIGVVYQYRDVHTNMIAYVGKCEGVYGGVRGVMQHRHKIHLNAKTQWSHELRRYPERYSMEPIATLASQDTVSLRKTLSRMEIHLIHQLRPIYNIKHNGDITIIERNPRTWNRERRMLRAGVEASVIGKCVWTCQVCFETVRVSVDLVNRTVTCDVCSSVAEVRCDVVQKTFTTPRTHRYKVNLVGSV